MDVAVDPLVVGRWKASMPVDVNVDARITKLPNGIRVATCSIPYVQSVSLGIWVGAGARYESEDVAGISHFIEHLLFKGTRKRSPLDISREIEGRGGYLNAFTQEESTCYYSRVPYDQLWRALDVLSDMYLNAEFASSEIKREKGVILEEIMMYRDQPQHLCQEGLSGALWKGHPLGRPVVGSPETIQAMNRKSVLEFRRAKYVPSNTVIALAGKVDHDACVERVAKFCGRLKNRRKPSPRAASARTGQKAMAVREGDLEQAHVALGIRLFGRLDERRYALRLLSAVLGENMSSRLFQVVREKHGLAYSVHSSCHLFRDTGALTITAGLDRRNYVKAMKLITKELSRLKKSKIGVGELKRAKEYLIGQIRLGMESTTSNMMWLGDHTLSYGRLIAPEETINTVSKVTADDINRLANAVLKPRRISVSIVSPKLPGSVHREVKEVIAGV